MIAVYFITIKFTLSLEFTLRASFGISLDQTSLPERLRSHISWRMPSTSDSESSAPLPTLSLRPHGFCCCFLAALFLFRMFPLSQLPRFKPSHVSLLTYCLKPLISLSESSGLTEFIHPFYSHCHYPKKYEAVLGQWQWE